MMRPFAVSALAFALTIPTAMAGYKSSSEKKDSRFGDNAFHISNALDSKKETCWQSDPEKDNNSQWLEIDVPVAEVDKIALISGWDKDEKTFKDYARIKAAKVEFYSKPIGGAERKMIGQAEMKLEDKQGWQTIDVPDLKIEGALGGTVRIQVTETYPGVDYPNLAVSELRIHLKEFPAETVALTNAPEAASDKNDAMNLIDGNARTPFIAAGKETKITAEAEGYGLASVGLMAGPKTHARPKTVVVSATDNSLTHEIPEDAKGDQWLLLPALVGYTGGAWGEVTIEVKDTWPGSVAENPLAIGELKINAATIEEF